MKKDPISIRKDARVWPRWKCDFLRNLAIHQGNVTRAIRLTPRSRYTIYQARGQDRQFSKIWDSIVEGFDKARRVCAAAVRAKVI